MIHGKTEVKCEECGKSIFKYHSHLSNRNFCTFECSKKNTVFKKGSLPWNKGVKGWTKECGAGFQVGHKGHGGGTPKGTRVSVASEFKKGVTPWNKGVHGIQRAWNKGMRKRPPIREVDHAKYAEWRQKIFARDNYTCTWCGERGGKLNADHIFSFALHPRKRYSLTNGRTLCEGCHRERTSKQLSVYWKNQFQISKHRHDAIIK